jgi:hypothetical protein
MAPIEFDNRKRRTVGLENSLTPAEIARLIEGDPAGDLPFELRSVFESGQTPVAYVRQVWSENATFYTANKGARSLIVVFCGLRDWPGIPTSYFLQTLRDDLYDVLVLQDPLALHFDRGISGHGSLLELSRSIGAFAEANGHTEIVTYGASMGGLPALRAGILLKADRAISVGGRYPWNVGRLSQNKEAASRAFDLLCPCFADSATQLVAIAGTRNEEDMKALEVLQQTLPACLGIKINTRRHSVAGFFLRAGLLPLFFACLFEYWHDVPVRSRLLALVEAAALHIHRLQATKREQHERQLQEIHESTTGWLTKPLRGLDVAMRRLKGANRG